MALIQAVSALKTDLGRELDARSEAEGILLGDWSFQVGTGGFNPSDPLDVLAVDPSLQTLVAPVGGVRRLGWELLSGSSASLALSTTSGFVTVTGLSNVPENAAGRWLRLTSADPAITGTWVIGLWNDATSVDIFAPLVTTPASGVSWGYRENCVLRPNESSVDFLCRLLAPDATVDGLELGEVGIFARVIAAPSLPSLLGTGVLWAAAHHVAICKDPALTVNHHVCVQS